MTDTPGVIRFGAHGPQPGGMEQWEEMDPAELVSGTPVQHGHTYHEIQSSGYISGVWDCTAFTAQMEPYSVDEFMFLLEGRVIMKMPDGEEITVDAGEAFVLPKGLNCQWIQPGYVRKFFMILDGPVPDAGGNASLGRVTKPDLTFSGLRPGALEAGETSFVNAAGTMQVCVSEHASAVSPARVSTGYELIYVLSGQLTVTDGDEAHVFAQGEAAYLIKGRSLGWETTDGTKLLTSRYCGD